MNIINVLTNPDILNYLVGQDNKLSILFNNVDTSLFVGLPKLPYVSLIGAVIGQIVRYEQAKKVRGNLYRLCGNNFTIDQIDRLTENDWKDIGLGSDKVVIIHNINNYISINKVDLNNIDNIRNLKHVVGVGKWTISTTILTSFMDWNEFPSGDLFIRKRIQKLYNMDKLPTIKQVEELSQRWDPYRTIVAWYFWRWF